MSRRRAVGAFLAGIAVLAGLAAVLGPRQLLAALADADPRFVAAAVVASLCWLCCWGIALRELAAAVGVRVSLRASILVTTAGTAITNVTPTGEPFTAYLLARRADETYERALAGVVALKAVNLFPTAVMAAVGFALLAGRLPGVDQRALGVFVAGFPLVLAAATAGAWLGRDRLATVAVDWIPGTVVAVSRVVPRWSPTRARLRERVHGFCAGLGRIAADRRRLLVAAVASTLGWVAVAASLFCSLRAVGVDAGFALPLLAVPVGTTASATVLPGGLGGTEALLTAVLSASSGTAIAVVGAAVLVHRGATYWLPIALGGGALLALVAGESGADHKVDVSDSNSTGTNDRGTE